jgi:thymidylate synthase (FAD)
MTAMKAMENAYKWLRLNGWSPQQARAVLPNSLKTEIVITANLREWRHIFQLRTSKLAHPQMREIMVPLAEALQKKLSIVFDGCVRDV